MREVSLYQGSRGGAVPSLPWLWDHVPISHLHRSQINPLLLCGLPCNGCRRKRNVIYLEILLSYSGSEWTYLEHQSPARSTSAPAHNKINPTCSQRESPRIMWSMAASVSSLQAKNVAYCRGLAMVFHKKTTSGNAGSLFLWGSCAVLCLLPVAAPAGDGKFLTCRLCGLQWCELSQGRRKDTFQQNWVQLVMGRAWDKFMKHVWHGQQWDAACAGCHD